MAPLGGFVVPTIPAEENAGGSAYDGRSPVRRPAFWCGALLILLGLAAAVFGPLLEIGVTKMLVILVVSAGTVEAFAGMLDRRAGGRTAAMDILLGLMSIGAGGLLSTPGWSSASALVYVITLWLLARGVVDIVGSIFMRSEIIQDARMIRAGLDILLGVLSWMALLVVPWWELLFDWPESTVGVIRTFAGLSVVAAGSFLVAESQVRQSPPSAASNFRSG